MLSSDRIKNFLKDNSDWQVNDKGMLERSYQFDSFEAAWSFLEQVAKVAQKQNHHPEIWNSFKKVKIQIISHDVGVLTQRDLDFVEAI